MYLLNGESKQELDISDRGFQYGDGLFETIEIINGSPVFLDQHLQRLSVGCKRLLIPMPELSLLKAEAYQLAENNEHAVLKLIVTRGSGGRGYRQPEDINTTRIFSLHPYPNYSNELVDNGINVFYCNTRLGLNPSLAGIKHLNRLEQVLARAEWNSPDLHEGLMMNVNNNIVEGTMSNIFLVKNNCLVTPELTMSGVCGVLRQIIIELAKVNKIAVIEKNIQQNDISYADEIFVTNSIIGIWPVKLVEEQVYKVGKITQQLQMMLLKVKRQDLNDC